METQANNQIPIVGCITPKQAENAVKGRVARITLHPPGHGGKRYVADLVRHADAIAKIAQLEHKVAELEAKLKLPRLPCATARWDKDARNACPEFVSWNDAPFLPYGAVIELFAEPIDNQDSGCLEWLANNQCQFVNEGLGKRPLRRIADCTGDIIASAHDLRAAIDQAIKVTEAARDD